jgi:chemotaxis protein methyltransferase CheR
MQEYTQNYLRGGGTRAFSEYYLASYDGAQFDRRLVQNTVFAQHNLVSDKAFNEFHVVMCRNVMIYFDRSLQERVLQLFDESLVTLGVLALGHKETLRFSALADRYEELDPSEKLYRKTAA